MKKLLSIVLALSLCLTAMMGCFVVSAETTNTVTVETVEIETGTATTEVDVTFDFDETFAASQFTVNFGALELTGISAPETVALSHNATADGTEDDFSVLNGSITCILDAANAEELGAFNEVVITLTFNTADLTANNYAITFTGDVASAGTYDGTWTGDEKMLDYTATAGAIVVEEKPVEPECEHANAVKSVDKTLTDVTTMFVFDCSCPDCGETWVQNAPVATDEYTESIGLNRSIDPQNDISLLYYFRKEAVDTAAVTNLVLYVEKEAYAKDSAIATIEKLYYDTYEAGTYPSISGERYFFKVNDVAPYEMGNDIDSKLYGMNANGEMVLLKTMTTYSIYTYAKGHFNDSTAIGNLLVDMLNYGAAAQVYGGFNANDLVNSYPEVLAAIESGLGTSDYPTTKAECFEWTNTATSWPTEGWTTTEIGNSRSLIPAEKVKIVMQINRIKQGTSIEDYYCVYNYYDVRGNEADPYTIQFSGDQYLGKDAFIFDQSPLSVLDYPVTATVYYGDPTNGGIPVMSCQYSVETYIARNIESTNSNLSQLMQTMYAYGNSMAALTGVTPAEEFFS